MILRDDNSLREKYKAKKFYNKYGKKIIAKYRSIIYFHFHKQLFTDMQIKKLQFRILIN